MQAVIGNDSFDAALADEMTLLADFLSDDGGGRIRIQKAAADDQADDLVGTAVIGLWSRVFQEQTFGTSCIKGAQDLIIALAREVIFEGGFGSAEALAFAFDDHGQAAADLVILGDDERAAGACEAELIFGERNIHREEAKRAEAMCPIICGGE